MKSLMLAYAHSKGAIVSRQWRLYVLYTVILKSSVSVFVSEVA